MEMNFSQCHITARRRGLAGIQQFIPKGRDGAAVLSPLGVGLVPHTSSAEPGRASQEMDWQGAMQENPGNSASNSVDGTLPSESQLIPGARRGEGTLEREHCFGGGAADAALTAAGIMLIKGYGAPALFTTAEMLGPHFHRADPPHSNQEPA